MNEETRHDGDRIEARLRRLERQNGRWRMATIALLLLAAAAVALVWANSPLSESYVEFWHTKVSIDAGPLHLSETLQHWVNDALMVIFFFVVGLEIKYELVHGDLRNPRTAALPGPRAQIPTSSPPCDSLLDGTSASCM